MTDVLLAPHNDDEALFASFLCLRYHPHVVVVLRSHKQGDNWARRELETARAAEVLDFTWEQWAFPDTGPDWAELRKRITSLREVHDRCFAPWPRFAENGWSGSDPMPSDGVCQHDRIGEIALAAFADRYTGYLTYTKAGKDEGGTPVPYEPSWVAVKFEALLCYASQFSRPEIIPHFLHYSLREFVARETPLPEEES